MLQLGKGILVFTDCDEGKLLFVNNSERRGELRAIRGALILEFYTVILDHFLLVDVRPYAGIHDAIPE